MKCIHKLERMALFCCLTCQKAREGCVWARISLQLQVKMQSCKSNLWRCFVACAMQLLQHCLCNCFHAYHLCYFFVQSSSCMFFVHLYRWKHDLFTSTGSEKVSDLLQRSIALNSLFLTWPNQQSIKTSATLVKQRLHWALIFSD